MNHRDISTTLKLTALAALAIGGSFAGAWAQNVPAAIRGKIVSATAAAIVLDSQGKHIEVSLAPDWLVAVVAPASLAQIQPGSFVGTTNVDSDVPDGGIATEVHIFPPGSRLGEGQRVMDAATNTRMTNGSVVSTNRMTNGSAKTTRMTNAGVHSVKSDNQETVLELTFAGGIRHVRVPATAAITGFTPADRSILKPGIMVSTRAQKTDAGGLQAKILLTGPNGTAPSL